jgi:hypothetical protein
MAAAFMLDIAAIGRLEGRLLDALLIAAIIDANTNAVLRDPVQHAAYARVDTPPPDELRRLVSINALACSLRQPFETVRRHVKKLVAEGYCVLTPQGLYVPTSVIASPAFVATAQARYRRLFEFCEELRGIDVVEPLPYRPFPAEDPRAPVRAVGRILSDYFFRTFEILTFGTPDPLTTVALLEVARSSSSNLSAAQVEATMRLGWIPNEQRTPVRVAQLARRIGAPYETTRRHIGWLVEHRLCVQAKGGVLPSEDYLLRLGAGAIVADNLGNLRRMFRLLATLEGEPLQRDAPPPSVREAADRRAR